MAAQDDALIRLRERGPLAAGQVRFLVSAVAPELDERAAAGAPHGRISPGAMQVQADGTVRLSGAPDADEADAHAAPEVLRGEAPTVRSEVFSLASSTYTLLTAHPPNPYGFATVRRARPDLDPQVDGVLARATARSPEFRFASASEYAAALAAALGAVDQPVLPAAVPTSPAPARTVPAPPSPAQPGARRFTVPDGALPVVFLVLVVLLAWGFLAFILNP